MRLHSQLGQKNLLLCSRSVCLWLSCVIGRFAFTVWSTFYRLQFSVAFCGVLRVSLSANQLGAKRVVLVVHRWLVLSVSDHAYKVSKVHF